MLVSGVQQSDSVMYTHVPIIFEILFPFRLLQNIEPSSLCYIVGLFWLSILNMAIWPLYMASFHVVSTAE